MEIRIVSFLGEAFYEKNATNLSSNVLSFVMSKVYSVYPDLWITVKNTTYQPIEKFYIVGDMQGWDINNPLEMINDKKDGRFNKIFYSYVKIDTGMQFKFFKTPGDWGSGYGDKGASGAGSATGYNQGGNFKITTTAIYRLTIDIENNMVYVQQKQEGVVGNMQNWDAAAPMHGGYVSRDKFIIIAPSNGSDQFKFHDGTAWDNSSLDKARWWGDAGSGKLNYDGNNPNLVATTNPRTRCIWNGDDKLQLKYELYPASEMRVVGNGISGVAEWSPSTSPTMTYAGNGEWTITLNLIAGKQIKFISENAFGAFDYEDASGGSTATGVARKIQWTGGSDFMTPTSSGSYTITLNEYTQTVTIN